QSGACRKGPKLPNPQISDKMQLKMFTIPVLSCNEEESVNRFLRSVKVLEVKKELGSVGTGVYWAICVVYLNDGRIENGQSANKEKIDYKSLLSEVEFKQFCVLRKLRKQLADTDAVPAFAVFTDSELAEIAKLSEINPTLMKGIKGIGNKKIEKYGEKLSVLFQELIEDEKGRLFD
ncbi:MAG: HRDC domain-containing protein, partial [Eubacterium sp.]|nr:HRDC domain-containing protein [Eubacterium sp.]